MSTFARLSILLGTALLAGSAPAQVELYSFQASAPDVGYGDAVAGLGDVDGDGFDDLAIGLPRISVGLALIEAGRLEIRSGKTGALIRQHLGEAPGGHFGWSVDSIGDVNGDGRPDYAVGAPGTNAPGLADVGCVHVFSGASGALLAKRLGPEAGDVSGICVAGVGDISGDGVPDYASGAPWHDSPTKEDTGCVYVYSGKTHALLEVLEISSSNSMLGFSVDGIADLDGDGRRDVVAGAPSHSIGWIPHGGVFAFSGSTGDVIFFKGGSVALQQFGTQVAGLGDVNGDGLPDLAVSDNLPTAAWPVGSVHVISGAGTQPTIWSHSNVGGIGGLAAIGDFDLDGRQDLACGDPQASFLGAPSVGIVRIFSGKNGAVLHTVLGREAGEQFGTSLAAAGLLNADAKPDLIASAPGATTGGAQLAEVRVHLLGQSGPQTYCAAKVNSSACAPGIGWSGAPSWSVGDSFHVTASDVLPGVAGVLLWSTLSGSSPLGGGTLCLSGQVKRLKPQNSGGILNLPCSGTFDTQLAQSFLVQNLVLPGQRIYAQYWSRDSGYATPNNISLTNALEVTVLP